MAVESEVHFTRGDTERARGCLLNLDKSLELLSQSESEHDTVFLQQMMPRALRCAVACYTMLGNLFFLEAKKVLARAQRDNTNPASFKDASYDKALNLASLAYRHAVKLRKREGGDPGFGHILHGEVLVESAAAEKIPKERGHFANWCRAWSNTVFVVTSCETSCSLP